MRCRFYQTCRNCTYSLMIALLACHVDAAEPVVLEGHSNVVSSVCFSRDSARLISGSWDKSVRIWDAATGKTIKTLSGHDDWVFSVALTENGTIVSATQRAIRRWPASNEKPNVFGGLGGPIVNAASFSPDAKLLATGGRDGSANLWRVGDDKPAVIFGGFESWVSAIAVSADHKTMATGTRIGEIRVLDLEEQRPAAVLSQPTGQQILALAINPAGDVLASGGIDTTVRLWELPSGKEIGKLSGHRGVITAIAWSADGKKIASGDRHGPIKVWDSGNQLLETLPGHSDKQLGFTVTTLAFSPDGRRLASGSYDKTVKVWSLLDE